MDEQYGDVVLLYSAVPTDGRNWTAIDDVGYGLFTFVDGARKVSVTPWAHDDSLSWSGYEETVQTTELSQLSVCTDVETEFVEVAKVVEGSKATGAHMQHREYAMW